MSWSSSEQGEILDTINSIPGTGSYNEWSAQRGPDGFIKLICYDGSAASLRLYPNATGDASVHRVIFSPAEPWGSISQWQLLDEGTLWVSHTLRGDDLSWRSGIYRITDISLRAQTAPTAADDPRIDANYPSPFNNSTTLRFTLPRSTAITLTVSDLLGREVRRIIDGGAYEAGTHAVRFDAAGLAPGLYFSRLTADGKSVQQKLLLQR